MTIWQHIMHELRTWKVRAVESMEYSESLHELLAFRGTQDRERMGSVMTLAFFCGCWYAEPPVGGL